MACGGQVERGEILWLARCSLPVPTATFRVLLVFFVLRHDRRRVVHSNITEFPNAVWTPQQVIEAFPEDTAPKHMLRNRDGIYGEQFRGRVDPAIVPL